MKISDSSAEGMLKLCS